MSPHVHTPSTTTPHNPVRYWEVCECGATREVAKGVPGPWHVCKLCTHPHGLEAL